MTNKDIVRYVLSKIERYDNARVNTDQMISFMHVKGLGELTGDQVRRSMREMTNVIKIKPNVWRVKGRKTPVKTFEDKTYPRMIWNSSKQGTYRKKVITHNVQKAMLGSS